MTRTPIDITPGLVSDDTEFAAAGRYIGGSNMRPRLGRMQTIGGWEALTDNLLSGVCRWAFPWGANDGDLHIAFGSHTHLQVWVQGGLYDVTPTLARPPRYLPDGLSVQNGDPKVTVVDPGHGLATGDTITVSEVVTVGGIIPNGTFAVTVLDADTYFYVFSASATSTATGGGPDVTIQPQHPFEPGNINGAGQAGYGTGAYGEGPYASPSADVFYPRTWSGGAYGQDLIASPRGGTIYRWSPSDTAVRAAAVANAPRTVTYVLVNDQRQVMAFGCNEELSGVFNGLAVRFSDIEDPEDWATTPTNNAGEVILSGGGRLVGARLVGQYVLAWTDSGLHLGTFIGDPTQTWRFDQVGDKCGLIGPNAAVVIGQRAFWVTPDGQFYSYVPGGEPQLVPCPIRDDFYENLAAAQAVKICASSIGAFNEVRWDYPDARDGSENSRYVATAVNGPDAGAWYRGQMARTAMVDAGPGLSPLGVESAIDGETATGRPYWHERGQSADGGALAWFLETGDFFLDDERRAMMIRDVEPDFKDQVGPISLTLFTREYPQSSEEEWDTLALAPDDDFVDFRAEGRLARIRYAGSSAPTYVRIGRPSFDIERLGRR